jgi:hypothetical protein
MADIRCPMCGKLNPDDRDECQHCQARLTPLGIKPFPTGSLEPEDEGGGLPDWLSAARESSPSSDDDPFETEESEDPADWLSRLQDDPEPEVAPLAEAKSPDGSEPESDGGDSDWLERIRSLRDQGEIVESPTASVTPTPPAFQDVKNDDNDGNQIPDWLDDLHAERGSQPSGPDQKVSLPASDSDEIPNWFSEISEQVESSAEEPDQLPTWMTSVTEPEDPTPEPAESAAEVETPDWLSNLAPTEEPAAADPAAADDLPDWLSSVEDTLIAPVINEPEDKTVEAEIPDWLSNLSSDDEVETPGSGEAEPVAIQADVPDWLSSLETDEEPASSSPAGSDEILDQLPGEDDDVPAGIEASEPEPAAAETNFPDWLSAEIRSEEASDQDDTPGWLSELDDETEPALPEPISMGLGDDSESLDWLSEEGLDFDIPDSSALEPESTLNLGEGAETPDWLENIGPGEGVPVETEYLGENLETASPFAFEGEPDDDLLDIEGLPDWLSSDPDAIPSPAELSDDNNLSPVELPGWLEAMRPADAEISPEGDEDVFVESAGPLAGLKSVLAAEPDVSLIQVSPSYSVKLEVEKDQRKHATLFEELLASEGEAKPVPRPITISTQRVLRWLIAFVLIIFVGFTIISESQNVSLPAEISIPDQTIAVNKLVNAAPDGSPVLLAFDYEPGMAGEMHATAAAVIDRLIVKGARFTLVSTIPSGPAIAEYFFQEVQTRPYIAGKDYVNLGYIPGGTTGLLSFAHTPQLVFPMSYDGNREPWNTPPLQNVTGVADFALVLIIAADPDVARAWIEQVQPRMGQTPLIAILSAQAEPMVRPYFGTTTTAQVQGIVSGLSGAAAYEVNADKNLGRVYWDAYSVGLIVAVAAILVGGTLNIISVIINRNSEDQEKST